MPTANGRVSLRLAMSLDGYIADLDGGYDWIQDVPSPDLDTTHQVPFDDYLQDVHAVVMGLRCFEQGAHLDYVQLGKPVIVAASQPHRHSAHGVEFTDDVLSRVHRERIEGRHCFLFGGGRLVTSFVQANLVDEFTVGIVPVLLGEGRRLFHEGSRRIDLRLVEYTIINGKARLRYQRRAQPAVLDQNRAEPRAGGSDVQYGWSANG